MFEHWFWSQEHGLLGFTDFLSVHSGDPCFESYLCTHSTSIPSGSGLTVYRTISPFRYSNRLLHNIHPDTGAVWHDNRTIHNLSIYFNDNILPLYRNRVGLGNIGPFDPAG
jgi:hypothetical protein